MPKTTRVMKDPFGGNADVVKAYDPDLRKRSLEILGVPCSLEEWRATMAEATPGGYNGFDVETVYELFAELPHPDKIAFIPGREGSVVVYLRVEGDVAVSQAVLAYLEDVQPSLGADELWAEHNGSSIRIWWD